MSRKVLDLTATRYLFKLILGFVLGATLFGCATYPDVNIDPAKNNKVTFRKDALECAQAYPEAASGAQVKQRIGCMNLKGWR
jgi:hypothetical protein